jgi:hypothetical protein
VASGQGGAYGVSTQEGGSSASHHESGSAAGLAQRQQEGFWGTTGGLVLILCAAVAIAVGAVVAINYGQHNKHNPTLMGNTIENNAGRVQQHVLYEQQPQPQPQEPEIVEAQVVIAQAPPPAGNLPPGLGRVLI